MDAPEEELLPRELVFVDLETTGGHPVRHRITEIGLVRVENGVVVEEWSSLINPECPIPSYIESFTGITNEMVEGAPRFADIARLVRDKLAPGSRRPVFAAHNARFDYSFLRAEFRRVGLDFSAPVLCTVKLSRRLFPEHPRHSLDAVMERHALSCSARHRALGDARVISDFWAKLSREIDARILAAAAHSAQSQVRLPAWLPEGLADELPEGPGTFRFYGAQDEPLYVGRTACLRSAVLDRLVEERPKAREFVAEVRRVEWTETAGELGAHLAELADIRSLEPRYNRRRKPVSDCTVAVDERTGRVEIAAIDEMEPEDLAGCFGMFRSPKEARKAMTDIARAKRLCLKELGLEAAADPADMPGSAAASCVAYQLGHCKGVCVGREPRALHAVRVRMALAPLKLKTWPFPGRVALIERGAMGAADLHVLDRWRYLGTARCDEELSALAASPIVPAFDVEVYRILARHLARHPALEWQDLEVGSARGYADVY